MNEARPIFITARFRSGSTLLWNLFRQAPSCCAFYEPLHNGLLAHLEHTQPHHEGVGSYWDEYWPIASWLHKAHREDFGVSRLHLEADDEYPELEQYIRGLIDRSGGRTPVLQFNRVDLRLPWLKRRFPEALLLHLRRNPRDTWVSVMKPLPQEEWDEPRSHDCYDQLLWSLALSRDFPFLSSDDCASSYEQHYYLWRLSGLMGERVVDCTLDYDRDLQAAPRQTLERLAGLVPALRPYHDQLLGMIQANPAGGWKKHRSDAWFAEIEQRCDDKLQRLGLIDHFGRVSLAQIAAQRPAAWEEARRIPNGRAVQRFLQMHSANANHLLRVAAWNTRWQRDKDGFEVNRRDQQSHIQFLEARVSALLAQTAAQEQNLASAQQRAMDAEAEAAHLRMRYGRTTQRVADAVERGVVTLKSLVGRQKLHHPAASIGTSGGKTN